MSRKRWDELDPRLRGVVLIIGTVEAALKVAALIDLARRSPSEVRGSKAIWSAAVALINSMGAVPIAYFLYGRRRG